MAKPKYAWFIAPVPPPKPGDPPEPTRIICYKSKANTQTVARLAVAERPSAFHDEPLVQATAAINAILSKVAQENKVPGRELAILTTPRGPMLAWTEYGGVGPDDEDEVIEKALGLS